MARYGRGFWGGLILAWLVLAPWLAAKPAQALELASDLRAEARQAARAGGPLLVIYSRADCKFCQTVKRDYLEPLAADPQRGRRLVIREIAQDSEQPLRDFNGQATTHARFAADQKIKLVPVVAFYGPDGRQLSKPIIGARIADFYQSYLDDAIEQASRAQDKP